MKVAILGAGISGLSIGKMLKEKFDVTLFEKKNVPGGIARTRDVDGISYHVTGGHCFNSKHQDVLDFVFNKIMHKDCWHEIYRDAAIRFYGNLINYPIEYSVKEIFNFDKSLAINIVKDFLTAEDNDSQNLENWFRNKFGNTLAEEYFIPYNRKIWNREPSEMSPIWVEGKLPIPDKVSFIEGLLESVDDKMPHSKFYYPNSNNQNTFIENLSSKLKINYGFEITSIKSILDNKWLLNNEYEFDILINTLPLDLFPSIFDSSPSNILNAATKLNYNKVTTMLWETKETSRTWTYIPNPDIIFHRYIHIGNFFIPQKNYTITEAVGHISYDDMVANGKKDPFLLKPLDYHVSNHAYVVFDENCFSNRQIILDYFNTLGIHMLGRFAEWEYYNMDICIKKAIDLNNKIQSNYGK